MTPIEIVVIIVASLIVIVYFGTEIYRKIKGKPSLNSDCDCTSSSQKLIAYYHKEKKREEKKLKRSIQK